MNSTKINYDGLNIGDDCIPLINQVKINDQVFEMQDEINCLEVDKSTSYEIIITVDFDEICPYAVKTNELIPFKAILINSDNKEKTGTFAYILKVDFKTDLDEFEIYKLNPETMIEDVKTGEYKLKDNIRDYEINDKIKIKTK